MKLVTLSDAQKNLPKFVKQAKSQTIGLTDESGHVVGLLAGVDDEYIDDLLVQTPGFKRMMERSRASLKKGKPVSVEDLLR